MLLSALVFASLAATHPLVGRADIEPTLAPAVHAPFPIDVSCNASATRQLATGLNETVALARTARDHLLKHGHASPIVQKYFGNTTTATPIGWYDRVISADRGAMLFRCDDPDENCATQDGWAGHWRGENATAETVICPLSFETRLYLPALCTRGYTVAGSAQNLFWATDLLHRVLHVPAISEGIVGHFADDYAGAVALKDTQPEHIGVDSDVLQFFAVEVYAWEVSVPGVGCVGDAATETTTGPATTVSSSASAASKTTGAATECHTHADGTEHCV